MVVVSYRSTQLNTYLNDVTILVSCIDRYPSCNYWRMTGECERRQSWMSSNCAYSCHFCAQNSLLSNNAIINHRC
jgi:hypothetical protein